MKRLALILALLLATPLWAVEPEEMLSDPALEARAQALDEELRCVKCRSESIASSNAGWAVDARLMVRELVSEGASDAEVKAFFVERYGDFVLMRPTTEGANLLLWIAGPMMLVAGVGIAFASLRRRRPERGEEALSEEETARLEAILAGRD